MRKSCYLQSIQTSKTRYQTYQKEIKHSIKQMEDHQKRLNLERLKNGELKQLRKLDHSENYHDLMV